MTDHKTLEALVVTTSDGTTFVLRLLPRHEPAAPLVLVLPAMAMKAKHYLPIAEALHGAGLTVATCDLRGQGESKPALREGPDFGYRHLLEVDMPAIVESLRKRFPGAPLYLFGHSLGGQIALLYSSAHRDQVAGIATIGTGTVFWRAFGPRRWVEALWKIQWIGLVSRVKGWWPGGVLIPGAMSGGVMIDWSRHSLTSWYRPKGSTRDYNALLAQLDLPVLLISLDADTLGPKSNVDFLGTRLPSAKKVSWQITEESGVANRDHFAWIKDSPVIGAAVAAWFTEGKSPA